MIIKYALFFAAMMSINISNPMEFPWDYSSNIPPVVSEFGGQELTYGYERVNTGDERPFTVNPFFFWRKVKKLIAQGANINACSLNGKYTPLSRAARQGDIERCAILLEFGADVNGAAADWTPLAAVVAFLPSRHYKKVYDFLLAHGADVNKSSERTRQTPIMVAAAKHWLAASAYAGNPKCEKPILQDLLDLGANPLARDVLGRNALHWAVKDIVFWDNNVPHLVIMEFFIRKREPIYDPRLFTFLCCLKRVLSIGDQQERFIASSLYSNRGKFMREFVGEFPSLSSILTLCNIQGKTAYDLASQHRKSDTQSLIDMLNPINSKQTEKIILTRMKQRKMDKIDAPK